MNAGKIIAPIAGLAAIGAFILALVVYRQQIMELLFPSPEEQKTQPPASQYIPQNLNIQAPPAIPQNFCPYCGQYFTTQELLQKHIAAIHNKVEYPRPAIYSPTPIAYIQGQPVYGP